MSRLIETGRILEQLNSLWDEHSKHISKANDSLKSLLGTASSIPSAYISTLKNISAAQEKVIKSTERLTSATKQQVNSLNSIKSAQSAVLQGNKNLQKAYTELEAKYNRVSKALKDMKSNTDAAVSSNDKLKAKIQQLEKELDGLSSRLNNADTAVKKIGSSSAMSFKTVSSLMSAFGVATGMYLFANIVKNIYETTKELQSLNLALKMVTETETEFAKSRQFISRVSEQWGLEVKSLTQQYIQFYTASKGLLSDKAIQTTFEGIAKAGSIMGLSVEKQSAAFYAIDQMMSKGTVSSEELKKQLGNALPGAIKAAAMAYMDLHPKITSIQEAEAKLYADMKKGAIDSATYVPLIVKNFQKLYGIENLNGVETLISKQNRLANSWTNFVAEINGSKSVLGSFFGWFIDTASFALNWWGKLLETQASKREKFLDSLRVSNDALAKNNLSNITGDPNKIAYATERISELHDEIKKFTAASTELEEKNKQIASKKSSLFSTVTTLGIAPALSNYKNNKEIAENQKLIAKNNNEVAKAQGLINGYMTVLNKVQPAIKANADGSAGDKRERVALNFDWIKSEYELRKAILERDRADSAHTMNDESQTLAKRLEARVEYTKKTMQLMANEAEEQKLLNLEKYINDKERDNVAYRNGDETYAKHMQNQSDINKRFVREQSKVDVDYQKKWKQLWFDNEEFSKKINEKKLEYARRVNKAEVDFYKSTLDEIINSKSVSDSEYLQAVQDRRAVEIREAQKERDEKIRLAGDEAALKTIAWDEYGNAVQAIDKKMNDAIEANRQRRIKRQQEVENYNRDAYGYKTVMGEDVQGYLSSASKDMKAKYEELLNNYKIAVASGDDAIIEERKRQLDDFKNYIVSVNEYATSFFDDFAKNSGFETLFKVLGKKITGFGDDWKTTFLAMSEIAQETVKVLDQNSQAYFDAEKARLEEKYKTELSLAGDNEAAKADIDKQYEERKRSIANREAKHARDMALFNIAVDTAQAIIGLWVKPGFPAAIPMAIAVGALGALQMAMVASRPVPQYYTGTDAAKQGLAWTDERGAEIHTDKFGRIKDFGSDSGPRLKYLSEGDKIIPAHRTKNIIKHGEFQSSLDELLFKNNILYNDDKNNKLDTSGIISSIHDLKTSILNKETSEEHFDVRGWSKFKKIDGQRILEKNNRIRFKKNVL